MRIDRKVIQRKDSLLVAIPAAARDHLGLVGGARVWWHIGAKRRLTLTTSGRAAGGRPTKDEDCPSCAKYRAELVRLRQAYAVRDVPTYNTALREGWHQAIGQYGSIPDRLDAQRDALAELRGMLRDVRTLAREVFKRTTVEEPRPWPFDHYPEPSPSPDVAGSEGEAVTPGPSVPGHP